MKRIINWTKIALQGLPRKNIFKHSYSLRFLLIGITCYQENILQNQLLALVRLQDAKTSFMYVITEAKSFYKN